MSVLSSIGFALHAATSRDTWGYVWIWTVWRVWVHFRQHLCIEVALLCVYLCRFSTLRISLCLYILSCCATHTARPILGYTFPSTQYLISLCEPRGCMRIIYLSFGPGPAPVPDAFGVGHAGLRRLRRRTSVGQGPCEGNCRWNGLWLRRGSRGLLCAWQRP